tara:strand:+ start:38 stop:310 length:273 start_codon:yes stop_codon:yes gene_type:complete
MKKIPVEFNVNIKMWENNKKEILSYSVDGQNYADISYNPKDKHTVNILVYDKNLSKLNKFSNEIYNIETGENYSPKEFVCSYNMFGYKIR